MRSQTSLKIVEYFSAGPLLGGPMEGIGNSEVLCASVYAKEKKKGYQRNERKRDEMGKVARERHYASVLCSRMYTGPSKSILPFQELSRRMRRNFSYK